MTETRPSRQELERALLKSALKGRHRHLLLTLLTHQNWRTRIIEHPPSLTELEHETGRSRTWVRDTLYELEDAGWITRRPPPPELAAAQHLRTAYECHVPGSPAHRKARQAPGLTHKERRELMANRIRVARDANRYTPPAAAAAAAAPVADAGAELELELEQIAGRELASFNRGERPPPEVCRETVRLVLDGRTVADPAAYLRSAIRREPRRFLPVPGPARPPAPSPAATGPTDAWRKIRGTVSTKRGLPAT
jgi:hypothetical protein